MGARFIADQDTEDTEVAQRNTEEKQIMSFVPSLNMPTETRIGFPQCSSVLPLCPLCPVLSIGGHFSRIRATSEVVERSCRKAIECTCPPHPCTSAAPTILSGA